MDNVKPWQLIVIVAAVIAVGFVGWKFGFGSKRIPQHDSILLVDVVTGTLYDAHKGDAKGILLPARAPDTNERTLFPVEEDESGVWRVRERYFGLYKTMQINSDLVGPDGQIEVVAEDPVYYEPVIPAG